MIEDILFTLISIYYFIYIYDPEFFNKIYPIVSFLFNNNFDFYKQICLNMLLKVLYYFSVCQIYSTKLSNIINPYLVELKTYINFNSKTPIIATITYFKNGKLEKNIELPKNLEVINLIGLNDTYDLLILSDTKNNLSKTYLEKQNLENQINHIDIDINKFEKSKIRFLSITLNHNNKLFEICLSNSNYNYYIVGNIIDKNFLYYFITHILKHNLEVNLDNFTYNIELLDDNVIIYNLDETHKIIINKDNYQIITNKKDLEETNNSEEEKEEKVLSETEEFIKI